MDLVIRFDKADLSVRRHPNLAYFPLAFGTLTFYIWVDDVQSLRAELVGRDVAAGEAKRSYYGMTQVGVTDPDGFRVVFQSPVAGPVEE